VFWERIDDLEALRIAIQAEMDTYRYYVEAMKKFTDREAKNLLAALAEEEKKHRKKLEEKYVKLSGKRLLYLNLPKRRRIGKPLDPKATVLDILRVAIETERESQEFYEKAAQRTLDAKGKKMLEELAEEERHHAELLEAEYRVRSKSGTQSAVKAEKVS
jgi:rubrerythrin